MHIPHYKCPTYSLNFLNFGNFNPPPHILPSTLVPSDRGGTRWLSAISSLSHTPIGTEWTCPVGRVENSKTFQNQMSQCFFIGLYDIETGDDFYFFQKKIFDGWKWILKKSIFTREKWLK